MMMAYRFLLLLEDCDELGPLHSTARDTAFNKTSALTTAVTTAETSCSGPSETTQRCNHVMFFTTPILVNNPIFLE